MKNDYQPNQFYHFVNSDWEQYYAVAEVEKSYVSYKHCLTVKSPWNDENTTGAFARKSSMDNNSTLLGTFASFEDFKNHYPELFI